MSCEFRGVRRVFGEKIGGLEPYETRESAVLGNKFEKIVQGALTQNEETIKLQVSLGHKAPAGKVCSLTIW